MSIPFLDLVTAHLQLEDELVAVFRSALRSAAFVGGSAVQRFEQEFAAFCGTTDCIGVASGTDAIRFAVMAAGVQPGETVLTVPNTFIATTEGVSQAGAHFDFVDVDECTYTLDPRKLQAYLDCACTRDAEGRPVSKRTGTRITAIIPVHLYGQIADMDAILEIASANNLILIEDACQAHGAKYFSRKEQRWRNAGSMGRAAAFSFYPGKNLGACGEGGAVTTDDPAVARRIRMLREHGQSKKYFHDMEGYNGRLDAIQAAFLSVKLRYLNGWNQQRRAAARMYDELFKDAVGVIPPFVPDWSKPVYHLYVVRVPDRDGVQQQLTEEGVGTGIHYPVPLHESPAYAHLGYRPGDFPVAERVAREALSLPMFPGLMPDAQQAVLSSTVRAVAARSPTALRT
jgi:dTDP-4-amino-4,6-dideoxygalactose transaminase